jgi:hypothetical protein
VFVCMCFKCLYVCVSCIFCVFLYFLFLGFCNVHVIVLYRIVHVIVLYSLPPGISPIAVNNNNNNNKQYNHNRYMDQYIHSHICLHGIMLNQLSIGATLPYHTIENQLSIILILF